MFLYTDNACMVCEKKGSYPALVSVLGHIITILPEL